MLFKRNKTWWTDFTVEGKRFRVTLKTTDRREAKAREKELIAEAAKGALASSRQDFAALTFGEAADRDLRDRKPELADSSHAKLRHLLVKPRQFFGTTRLNKISNEMLRDYRQWRLAQGIGPATLNAEERLISHLLKRAKVWHRVGEGIRRLKEPKSIGRAMSREQAASLMEVATSKPEWQNAQSASVIAMNTTMRGMEIKGLRWRDVDLGKEVLTVRKSKTAAGVRDIPLNERALAELKGLHDRAVAVGAASPEHFVFPACENGHFDPTRPVKSWRTAWRTMTKAVKCPACGLIQAPALACKAKHCEQGLSDLVSPVAGLRFHDLRHHAITELAESQASDSTIMAIAGHVSRHMMERYSHIRQDAKRAALEGIGKVQPLPASIDRSDEGYDTNHGTNDNADDSVIDCLEPYEIESAEDDLVDLVGIEPTTSSMPWNWRNRKLLTDKWL
jgi:integrase